MEVRCALAALLSRYDAGRERDRLDICSVLMNKATKWLTLFFGASMSFIRKLELS